MIQYSFQVSLYWGIGWLLYYFLLRKETFYVANRAVLIFSVIAGLILPVIDFQEIKTQTGLAVWLEPVTVGWQTLDVQIDQTFASGYTWRMIISMVYAGGAAWMLIRLLHGLLQILSLSQRSTKVKTGDYFTFKTNHLHTPFSFFRMLFWSEKLELTAEESLQVRMHEEAHIRQGHSFDILVLELCTILFWWNPFIYVFKSAVRDVHEYLADQAALKASNHKQYGHLLIRQSLSGPQVALANHFIHSQLKKRILMMTKKQSGRISALKYLSLLPAFLLLFLAQANSQKQPAAGNTATPVVAYEQVDTVITYDPVSYKEEVLVVKKNVYLKVDEMPRFPGCENLATLSEKETCSLQKLSQFISDNLVYPAEAKQKKWEGMVVVQFTVHANMTGNNITDVSIVKGANKLLDEAAIKVVQAMPRWIPGKQGGKPADVQMNLPIQFKAQ